MSDAEDPTCDSPIDILPDECLIEIFSYLNVTEKLTAEKVCKRWLRVSRLGWSDVRGLCFKWMYPQFKERHIRRIFHRCGRYLEYVSIPVNYQDPCYSELLEDHCPQLRMLQIVFDKWATRPVLESHRRVLAKVFPKFEKLEAVMIHGINSDTSNQHLRHLPETLANLSLYGRAGKWLSAHFYGNITQFRNLSCLLLKNFVIKEGCLQGIEELENLRTLNLTSSELFERDIERIQKCEKLEELSLAQGSQKIRDCHILGIAEGCRNLRILRLDELANLSDDCFRYISGLPNLQELYMNCLPKVTNRAIAGMKQVYSLACRKCPGITNEGLKESIGNSSNLGFLSVRGTADMETFLGDADEAVRGRKNDLILHLDVGQAGRGYPVPENFSHLIKLI